MANKKITDFPELTTVSDNDWLYIVDVSDLSESDDGTSKKIKKSNIVKIDQIPTDGSTNAVSSNGVFDALKVSIETGSTITTIPFGGIPAGTNIQNRSFESLFIEAMIVYLNPAFTSFSSNYPLTVEVGTTISGNITFTWTTENSGNVKPNTLSIIDVNTSTAIASGLANDGSEIAVANTIILNALNAVQACKIRGLNTNDIFFESSNITTTAKFRIFFGAVSATPTTSAQVRALSNNTFPTLDNIYILNTGNTLTKFVVALPSGTTIVRVEDLDALSAIQNYVLLGTIQVNDAGGTPRTYNLYEMNLGAPYATSHRHKIITI